MQIQEKKDKLTTKLLIHMKFIHIIAMVLFFGSLNAQSVEEKIADIRSEFKTIESAIKNDLYLKEVIDFEDPESDSYGTITMFKVNNKIRKLAVEQIYNETNEQTVSFYIKDDKLFFAYLVGKAPQIINERETKYHNTEKRYYFYQEQPIRCLEKKYETSTTENSAEKSQRTSNIEIECKEANSILLKYKDFKQKL